VDQLQRLVERRCLVIDVPGAQPKVDTALVALHDEAAEPRHRGRQRLRPTHATKTTGQDPATGGVAAEVLGGHGVERLVRSLHDALGADVDPAARRHLPVHHQASAIQFVEVLPRRPLRHQV